MSNARRSLPSASSMTLALAILEQASLAESADDRMYLTNSGPAAEPLRRHPAWRLAR